eukprot:TRINITY_DN34305_c0_g1_i1.p1 TRINITY_DN34305_c0_g1~~TRINITY_DN34305_c0_g1_i1.p1  ORF type:complete len:490 (-),score=45.86 TRINITY_DN34305_c0_g1_i1:600-2069(-)
MDATAPREVAYQDASPLGQEGSLDKSRVSDSSVAHAARPDEDTSEEPGYLNIGNILKLGLSFFLVFCAYISIQNLMPQLLKELGFDNLGFLLVAVIYAAFTISCIIAPVVLQYVDERRAVVASSAGYGLFTACGILLAKCTECPPGLLIAVLVMSAANLGFCAAFLWVAQGALMTYNSPQRLANTYQTIFQVFMQSAAPAGFVISFGVVGDVNLFFLVFTCISCIGTAFLCTLRPPVQHPTVPKCKKDRESLRKALAPLLQFLRHDSRSRQIGAYGVFLAVWFNGVPACIFPMFAHSTSDVAILLVVLGIGQFAASLVFSTLANSCGRFVCMLSGITLDILGLLMLIVTQCSKDSPECNSYFPFIAVFSIGVGSAINFTNLAACITAAVHDKTHAGFATQHLYLSASSVASFVLLPEVPPMWAQSACIGVALATATYLVVHRQFFQTLELKCDASDSAGPEQCVAECGAALPHQDDAILDAQQTKIMAI